MKLDKIIFATILVLCGLVFADMQEQKPEQQAGISRDSVIIKQFALSGIGYLNGLELSGIFLETDKNFKYSKNDYIFRYAPGYGVILGGKQVSLPIFFNARLGLKKDDFEYFFNNRLGTSLFSQYSVSEDEDLYSYEGTDACFFCDIFYEPSIGIQYKHLNLSLGYNFSSFFENSFVIRAGIRSYYEKKVNNEQKPEQKAEIPEDSLSKSTTLYSIGTRSHGGIDASMSFKSVIDFKIYYEGNFAFRYGSGFGLYFYKGDYLHYSLPVFYNLDLGLQFGYFEYFLNNRFGTNIIGVYRDNPCYACDFFYEPSLGIQYRSFNLALGYNISSEYENSVAIRAGYNHYYKNDTQKSSRYFRPGIELNYPIWRSEIDFFDNSFPYKAFGGGLFFRIGPESIYLTTGIYVKLDIWEKQVSKDIELYGFSIPGSKTNILDLSWGKLSNEIPLLLSFGSGQIKFTTGLLFDFYTNVTLDVKVSESVPLIGGTEILNVDEDVEEGESGDTYFVLGLDCDIVRHWGIGVKFLIKNDGWKSSEFYSDFEPSRFQTRVSTYFIF